MAFDSRAIAGRRFGRSWRGYDVAEVDRYLRAVAADHRELVIRLEELERAVVLALRPGLPPPTAGARSGAGVPRDGG